MAAGIGSRFGGGIKQLEPVGLHGEIIMDYSIHDAIAAGFNKIVFVIRKDIESDFKERIGNRIEKICAQCGVETAYAFQDLNEVPGIVPEGRSKPWGTGQAVLAARDMIAEPFLVINADDYYGKEAYQKMHAWLCEEHATKTAFPSGLVEGRDSYHYEMRNRSYGRRIQNSNSRGTGSDERCRCENGRQGYAR